MANNTFPNTKKLSKGVPKSLSDLKEYAEEEPDKYYIPAIKADAENYIVPVSDFGKGGGSDILRIFDTVAKYNYGLQYLAMSLGDENLALVDSQNLKVGLRKDISSYASVPGFSGYARTNLIDMSEISCIDWLTWHSAAVNEYTITDVNYPDKSIKQWDVYNPYIQLALDTKTMKIGKVYVIRIHAVKSQHDNTPNFVTVDSHVGYNTKDKLEGSTSQTVYYNDVPVTTHLRPSFATCKSLTNASGTVKIQNATQYYDGHYPGDVQAGDLVFEFNVNDYTTVFAFDTGTNNRRPKGTSTAVTVNATYNSLINGAVVCNFTYETYNGHECLYRITIGQNIVSDVRVSSNYIIPEAQWKYYDYTIDGDSISYSWKTDIGPQILAPLDGPRFYWPYLMNKDYEGAAVSIIEPHFYVVNTEGDNINTGPSSIIAPTSEYDYTPSTPKYEAVVYMCRIDNDHVLILGY